MIGILFSDVDGTLYHENYNSKTGLNRNTVRMLETINAEVPFYICSGRSLENFRRLPYIPHKGGIIEFGAYVQENDVFDNDWQQQFDEHRSMTEFVDRCLKREGLRIIRTPHTLRLSKAELDNSQAEEIKHELLCLYAQKSLDLKTVETTYEIIVMPQGASKESAIIYLCGKNGISLDQAAYIGDGKRDIPIMELVSVPITLASAKPEVKDLVRNRGGFVADKSFVEGTEQTLDWFIRRCLEQNA
ncbi:MAG: HAD-IIB family hydrolase [Nanoarchaeota archaeon]|nr:HAD-IIB family hydrolase [Nanoarchaeota archaeon]MBU1270422.1 HAD-IIB family hydrolase [Nanoarchaeota archaeon]MBU1604858.1 HAD-IIB family hydrolase [Nanoarchaeota archaeon]MBU2442464.1 HAD-IIB family hydrolase [Nanoarchaeota archaeon]